MTRQKWCIVQLDFSYDNMTKDVWDAHKIVTMARTYQPDMIIDNRLEGDGVHPGTIMDAHPSFTAGDFTSPEQMIPPQLNDPPKMVHRSTYADFSGYY